MDKQIVYILSTNYAGSHFLALQLGSSKYCASIGEFHRFKRSGNQRTQACHLCENDEKCPFFAGLDGLPKSLLYSKLFENLKIHDAHITTVIDNSKKVRWARHFLDLKDFQKKYIHLIRDPRALVRRWLLNYDNPQKKRKVRLTTARRCPRRFFNILLRDEINVYIQKWLYQNQQITQFLNYHNPDTKLITYYQLVNHSDKILSDIMNWLGLTYTPDQKEYWNFVHHGSIKDFYMRAPEEGEKIYDQRWKTFLDDKSKHAVVNHPMIQSYLHKIGLSLDLDKGLIGETKE